LTEEKKQPTGSTDPLIDSAVKVSSKMNRR